MNLVTVSITKVLSPPTKIFDMNGSWDMGTDLGKKFIHADVDGKFRKHVHELSIFNQAMYVCGKYYDLPGTSPQDGDHKAVKWVMKTALDSINEEYAKKLEDWDADEEDKEKWNEL